MEFQAVPGKGRRREHIEKTVHHRARAIAGISEIVARSQRMVQAGGGFERYTMRRSLAEEGGKRAGRRNRVRGETSGADLGESARNAVERRFAIRRKGEAVHILGFERLHLRRQGSWFRVDEQGDPPWVSQGGLPPTLPRAKPGDSESSSPAMKGSTDTAPPRLAAGGPPGDTGRRNRPASPAALAANLECEACASILIPCGVG